MKIVDVELYPINVTPEGFGPGVSSNAVIIRILTDSSLTGLGEATTLQPGEANGALMGRLGRYATALVGADPLNLNEIQLRLDKTDGASRIGCRAARAALDMGVYDLIGKARGVPVYTVLGGALRTELEVQLPLPEGSVQECADSARQFFESGIRGVKVAIGGIIDRNGEPEKRRVLAALETLPSEIQIDVDAKQSWSNAGLARSFVSSLLDEVFPGNLALEQPLHHLDLDGHSELRERLPIPIVLSDSVVSAQAMMQIVHTAAADRIVIDSNRVGGLTVARQIADICEAAAVGVSVGWMAGTRLGATAHAHLASTVRDPLPFDVGYLPEQERSPFSGGFDFTDGLVVLRDLPGLGVDVDVDVLKTLQVQA